jgi:tetratricopeptide (TPR) repeat protein
LLAARLDQLDVAERAVLERGSVEGRTFHRGAVAALTDGNGSVDQRLLALVRKELVRPDSSELPGDDAYRFRHLLIRDAAYDALPKATRAELHERFADWLEDVVGERNPEYEAVIGHHLEQAYRCRADLGMSTGSLAERAGSSLAAAGRAAFARGDSPGAMNLFTRALDLLPVDHPERADLLIGLAHAAHDAGEFRRSGEAAHDLIELGREKGDARLESRGRVQAMWIRIGTDPTVTMDELQGTAEAAIPILEKEGDEAGLARAFQLLSHVHHFRSSAEEHLDTLELALEHARRAGDTLHEAEIMAWLAVEYFFGSMPIEQGQPRLERILAEARTKSLVTLEGIVLGFLGGVEAMRGRFEEAREIFLQGRAIMTEIGLRGWIAGETQIGGYIEMLAADYSAAEREFRFGYEEYERMGETGVRSTSAAMLAEALYELDRDDEAEQYVQLSRETAAADDYASQIGWRMVAARLLARRGDLHDAEQTAREATALFEESGEGQAIFHPAAWAGLGEVLFRAGKREEAEGAFANALRLHEQKGNIAGAARTREQAARLGLQSP